MSFSINCLDDSNCSTTTQQQSDNNDFHSDVRMLRGFKIAHLNVNRLVNKLDHVNEFVYKHSFDVLTLSETWLVPNIMDKEITIPGYSLVRKDRHSLTKSCGGGVIREFKKLPLQLQRKRHSSIELCVKLSLLR